MTSYQDARLALANAASNFGGIDCSPNFRQITEPGSAMVRLDHVDYPNVFGGLVTWQVAVILPQDYAQAEDYLDSTIPQLVAALADEMTIRKVTPSQLVLGTSTVPVVIVEGQREE